MTMQIRKRSVDFFSGENSFAVSAVKGKMMKSCDNKYDVKDISVQTRQGIEDLT